MAPRRRIPDEIADICIRATSLAKEDRFFSATDLGDAVEAFLEGSLLRERALELVDEARTLLHWVDQQRDEASGLQAEASAMSAGTPDTAQEDEKAPAWEREDKAAALRAKADLDEVRFVQTAQSALERVPDLSEAHDLLADFYKKKHAEAEGSQDGPAAARFDLLLRAHDRGRHDAYIRGLGALTLVTDPPGARATLLEITTRQRRRVTTFAKDLGATPLVDVPMRMGSIRPDLEGPAIHRLLQRRPPVDCSGTRVPPRPVPAWMRIDSPESCRPARPRSSPTSPCRWAARTWGRRPTTCSWRGSARARR